MTGLLAACAFITVNVYFPEKDVKQAYRSLDEMLLKQGGEEKKELSPQEEEKAPEQKPVSLLPAGLPGITARCRGLRPGRYFRPSGFRAFRHSPRCEGIQRDEGATCTVNALRDSGVVVKPRTKRRSKRRLEGRFGAGACAGGKQKQENRDREYGKSDTEDQQATGNQRRLAAGHRKGSRYIRGHQAGRGRRRMVDTTGKRALGPEIDGRRSRAGAACLFPKRKCRPLITQAAAFSQRRPHEQAVIVRTFIFLQTSITFPKTRVCCSMRKGRYSGLSGESITSLSRVPVPAQDRFPPKVIQQDDVAVDKLFAGLKITRSPSWMVGDMKSP